MSVTSSVRGGPESIPALGHNIPSRRHKPFEGLLQFFPTQLPVFLGSIYASLAITGATRPVNGRVRYPPAVLPILSGANFHFHRGKQAIAFKTADKRQTERRAGAGNDRYAFD